MTENTTDTSSSKVARLIEEYQLEGFGEELEAYWTADGTDRMSLRELSTLFNKRLLRTVLLGAGLSALESDVETTYRHLTGENVSTGVRTETRTRLEQNGVDVDQLETDFVTYQAIRSYLKDVRGASYEETSDAEKIDNDIETIQRLLTRTQSVIDSRIESLRDTDRIAIDEFEVLLDAQVLCQSCGKRYPITELLEERKCDCHQD